MGFNYGLEKRKFTEEWKKLYSEYKAAGMSEEDIQDTPWRGARAKVGCDRFQSRNADHQTNSH